MNLMIIQSFNLIKSEYTEKQNFQFQILDATLTLKYDQGHYFFFKVWIGEVQFVLKLVICHIYSLQETWNVKFLPHLAGWLAWLNIAYLLYFS